MRNIESHLYNVVKIPKKNGGFRYIYIPSESLKEKLQSLLPAIKNLYDKYKKVDWGVFKSLCQIFTLKKYSREIDT